MNALKIEKEEVRHGKQTIVEINYSSSIEVPSRFLIISKQEDPFFISVIVDEIEIDEITVLEFEKTVSRKLKFEIEIIETFYSGSITSGESLSSYRLLQPFYFVPKRRISVETQLKWSYMAFEVYVSSSVDGPSLFSEISTILGLESNKFRLVLEYGSTTKPISRSQARNFNEQTSPLRNSDARLIVLPLKTGDIPIPVRFGKEDIKMVNISEDATVADLKESIDIQYQIPSKDLLIVIDSEYPKETLKVLPFAKKGIRCFSNTNARPEITSPILFIPDISRYSNIVKYDFSPTAPEWRVVSTGLNIVGKCTNEKCKANTKEVIVQWGFKLFNWSINLHSAKCPICESKIRADNVGFNDCEYAIVGTKFEDGLVRLVKSEIPIEVEDLFQTFLDTDATRVDWGELIILTGPYRRSNSLMSDRFRCLVCKKILDYDADTIGELVGCRKHKLHSRCCKNLSMQVKKCIFCEIQPRELLQ